MFSFLFKHISHFSWKCDLSQNCSFTRFCIDDCNLHSLFCGCGRCVVGSCCQSGAGHVFISKWCMQLCDSSCEHPRTWAKVAYFLRVSEGNWVKLLQCLDCKTDKRDPVLVRHSCHCWNANDRTGSNLLWHHEKLTQHYCSALLKNVGDFSQRQ